MATKKKTTRRKAGRMLGYARVSTTEQDLTLQLDALKKQGCAKNNIFSALAQFEQRLIQERTCAGVSAARARGRKGRRKPLPPTDPKVLTAKKMYQDRSVEVRDIRTTLNISRSRLYRYVAMEEQAGRQAVRVERYVIH